MFLALDGRGAHLDHVLLVHLLSLAGRHEHDRIERRSRVVVSHIGFRGMQEHNRRAFLDQLVARAQDLHDLAAEPAYNLRGASHLLAVSASFRSSCAIFSRRSIFARCRAFSALVPSRASSASRVFPLLKSSLIS